MKKKYFAFGQTKEGDWFPMDKDEFNKMKIIDWGAKNEYKDRSFTHAFIIGAISGFLLFSIFTHP